MYYVCIENQQVVSMVNYKPAVPASIQVLEITDQQFLQVDAGELIIDAVKGALAPAPQEYVEHAASVARREAAVAFLDGTDWKVMRHIREMALGLDTTLTHDEYIELERERQAAAARA